MDLCSRYGTSHFVIATCSGDGNNGILVPILMQEVTELVIEAVRDVLHYHFYLIYVATYAGHTHRIRDEKYSTFF